MGDIADKANEHIEKEHAGNVARSRKPDGPEEVGQCRHCSAPLIRGRWCDAICRDDWQKDQDRMKRQGRTE